MNNIRVLTGGLVLIVLALAGGTGYLLYERINSEIGPHEKATKEEVNEIRTDVVKLKDNDVKQTARIEVLEDEVVDAKRRISDAEGKLDLHKKMIQKLEGDVANNAQDIAEAKEQQKKMEQDLDVERKRLDNVEAELAQAKKEREEIRKQLKAQGERIDEQEKRIDEMEKKGDARDEEIAALKRDLAELRKQLGLEKEPTN